MLPQESGGRVTDRVDRKLQRVRLAEYQYRHEAEFAAGFLEDAGIPYRLQLDDAGGADLGLSMLRPAVLWVRTVDAEVARDVLALEEEDFQPEPEPVWISPDAVRLPRRRDARLTVRERLVSGCLGATFLAVAPNLPYMELRDMIVVACAFGGVVFLAAAFIGRARGAVGGLIQMLAGSPPR